jgi:hypothetical protein
MAKSNQARVNGGSNYDSLGTLERDSWVSLGEYWSLVDRENPGGAMPASQGPNGGRGSLHTQYRQRGKWVSTGSSDGPGIPARSVSPGNTTWFGGGRGRVQSSFEDLPRLIPM